MLIWETKYFNEISTTQLYEILQLRSAIFVVEQDCVYQDIDGKDQKAIHILGYKNNILVAYTRCFKPNDYFEFASIGRVLVKESERKFKYGHALMQKSIAAIETIFNETTIKISAQTYLKKFYESQGFVQIGDGYLEDGIPHIAMLRE